MFAMFAMFRIFKIDIAMKKDVFILADFARNCFHFRPFGEMAEWTKATVC